LRIYLDHNATTPLHPDVAALVARLLTDEFGNPSSVHTFGQRAKAVLDEARSQVAALIDAEPGDIVFTAGGTEADNFAIRGAAEALAPAGRRHLIASSIEHEAVLTTMKALERRGWEVTLLPLAPMPFDGGTLQVVVVSGTYPGEGDAESRVDVFPVVDDGEGFRVEHLAFDPARDNDITFTLPEETEEGLGSMAPTEEVNVFVPAQGTAYLQLDGTEVLTDETSEVAGRPFALFHPEGDLAPGEHVLVLVAVGDDGTVTAFGGSFTVEA